ncbi:hypothetical protein Q9L58_010045 [Maublancomyces gigas]|uniref:SH3b domain-containing protein n=1 Tax=Discina gigas TaxID=1032678 RepID=A0ABR3G571_9PEZI
MKSTTFIISLLFTAVMALPVAEPVADPAAAASTSCQIMSADGPVNVRAGPNTGSRVVTTVDNGDYVIFQCRTYVNSA